MPRLDNSAHEAILAKDTPFARACAYALEVKWKRTRHYYVYTTVLARLTIYFESVGITSFDAIRKPHLLAFAEAERAEGNAENTIAWKIAALKAVVAEGLEADPQLVTQELPKIRIKRNDAPKWWLTPEARERLTTALRTRRDPEAHLMADYVDFVCLTGVRVEEALRFDRSCFRGLDTDKPIMWVPGTKTRGAANSLPMGEEAAALVARRFEQSGGDLLFPVDYGTLAKRWNSMCRPIVDPDGNPTATLKALRRTFGWYVTQRGTPTAILQKLYRHSKITTTAGYLNLIGGSDAEALRQWV